MPDPKHLMRDLSGASQYCDAAAVALNQVSANIAAGQALLNVCAENPRPENVMQILESAEQRYQVAAQWAEHAGDICVSALKATRTAQTQIATMQAAVIRDEPLPKDRRVTTTPRKTL